MKEKVLETTKKVWELLENNEDLREVSKVEVNFSESEENGNSIGVSLHLQTDLNRQEVIDLIKPIFDGITFLSFPNRIFIEEDLIDDNGEIIDTIEKYSHSHLYFSFSV